MAPRDARDAGSVAVIGMECIFPGAGDLATFRRNLEGGVDAIREVPPARWEPLFYEPGGARVDRIYCRRGGFVDEFASFDALRWGVMPVAAEATEPDQLLTLEVCARALADAGYAEREFPRATTGVILGRGGYPGRAMTSFQGVVRTAEQLVQSLHALLPELAPDVLEKVRADFQRKLGHHGPDTVIGIVPNLAASRVANRLDLAGASYTVDAACASSLVAIDRACADLASGKSDLVLAGGVHLNHDVVLWSVFCQLGALSRREEIRPFDRGADGLLMGEGIGVCVLKRLADAERDGDRVYAVIRGTGTSSDGREASLFTPRVAGQVLALERAWAAAGLDPLAADSVGLVEAHGTGTPAGDAAELQTLRRVFGPPPDEMEGGAPRPALGSVKSMIGHTMPAAGAAGFIKAVLALHHRVLPPTLHCEEPLEALAETRFRALAEAEPWEAGRGPRRAAVDSFGFGGINAHAVLEEHRPAARGRSRAAAPRAGAAAAEEPLPPALLLAAATPAELAAAVRRAAGGEAMPGPGPGTGPARVAVLDPTPERLERAAAVVERGADHPGRRGIWFRPEGLLAAGGKLAYLFPGVDAEFRPRVADVARHFGRTEFELPSGVEGATELELTGVGIVLVNRLLFEVLGELGLAPDCAAGHSIGEWSAMLAAGVLDGAEVDGFMRGLEPGSLQVPGVVFAAAGAGTERVEPHLAGLESIAVSHDNCPHQVLLCGVEASVDAALAHLRKAGVLCQKLDFRSGFHTPLFEPFVGRLRSDLGSLSLRPPALPLPASNASRISISSTKRYDQTCDRKKSALPDH